MIPLFWSLGALQTSARQVSTQRVFDVLFAHFHLFFSTSDAMREEEGEKPVSQSHTIFTSIFDQWAVHFKAIEIKNTSKAMDGTN